MSPISQPRGTINTASLTLDHTHALNMRFLNQLYSRQLRVSLLFCSSGIISRLFSSLFEPPQLSPKRVIDREAVEILEVMQEDFEASLVEHGALKVGDLQGFGAQDLGLFLSFFPLA